jgi:hypothetical protein
VTIVQSVYTTGHLQADGRSYIREVHTDHLGGEYRFEYLWDGADRDAILSSRASQLAVALAEREYREHVEVDGWSLPLEHQTGAQFADRLREEYRNATKERCCYLAWWLIRRLDLGELTDAAVRNAFGMTVTQYNAFKTRMRALHDHWAAVIAAVGE